MTESTWSLARGAGPVLALAIHDGHEVRPDVRRVMALGDAERLREEDPHTATWADVAPSRMVAIRSRFEVDLNRPRERAVYLTSEDAWGLEVWREPPAPDVVRASLGQYDAFYRALDDVLQDLRKTWDRFLVLDLHSYNHRRDGPHAPAAASSGNPQINVGTGTMLDRGRWAGLVDRFITEMRAYDFPAGPLDVRENVRFRGGNCARWIHGRFPESACVLSIEVKKFFMDEWTADLDTVLLGAIGDALRASIPGAVEELTRR